MKDYILPIYHARKPRYHWITKVLEVITLALLFIVAWLWLIILA
jgi:hypothetical protein